MLLSTTALPLLRDRTDRVLFALSQLPDDYRLEVAAEPATAERLTLLSRAYGLEDRVRMLAPGTAPSPGARRVDPFAHRTVAGLLHEIAPEPGPARAVRGDDGILRGHRFGLLTNRPTHYRVPLWNELQARVEAAGAELRIFSTSGQIVDRPHMVLDDTAFDNVYLRAKRVGPLDFPADLERRLKEFRPTVVISPGFSTSTTGRALLHARRNGVPFGLWSGEPPRGERAESKVRRVHRRITARGIQFSICYSSAGTDYVHQLAPAVPSVVVRNTTLTRDLPAPPRSDDEVRVITVARALPGKRLDVVIDAVRRIEDPRLRLTIVGDGPALPALRAQAEGDARIELVGSVPSDRVLEMYAAADVFVFPTQIDVFGLVMVEAYGAGLATVTSPFPGAADDLAIHEANCLVVEGTDPGDWAAALRRLIDDPQLRRRLGDAARRTIADRWTIAHSTDAWVAGFRLGALLA